jgi:hypothetical protein
MAGLVPAIHVFLSGSTKDVDARHKAGHDEVCAGTTSPQSRRRLVMTLIAAVVRHAITDAETGAPAPCHDQPNAA